MCMDSSVEKLLRESLKEKDTVLAFEELTDLNVPHCISTAQTPKPTKER